MKSIKLCPILRKTVVIHNSIHDARVPHIGINAIRDNDVIISEFSPCLENKCMMFNNNTGKCQYSNNKNFAD